MTDSLPGLMSPPGALQRPAVQDLPAQAQDRLHCVRMRGVLYRHAGDRQVVLWHAMLM